MARLGPGAVAPDEWIVSVDDHVIEPPDLWVDRVPRRDRERAPRTIVGDDGILYWVYESTRMPISRTIVQAARPLAERTLGYVSSYDDVDPWYFDPVRRTEAMDLDGVLASLCFPMVPRFCGQTFLEASDRAFALTCLRTWNDWMVDEWAGAAPGRFIPLVIIPLWDPPAAAAEIERCAAKGARAISFSENPTKLGLPSLHDEAGYWDPVLAAANDTQMPLCVHFGSSSSMPTTSADAPLFVTGSLAPINLVYALVDWLFCGKLLDGDRSPHPDLKICLSEGGIGWIPYMLERCDQMVVNRPYLADTDWRVDLASGAAGSFLPSAGRRMGVLPSEVFRRHVFGCFIDDHFGARHLAEVGVDNVMLETDFPHGDSTFPHSQENARALLAGQPDAVRRKVMRENAERVFRFVAADRLGAPADAPLTERRTSPTATG